MKTNLIGGGFRSPDGTPLANGYITLKLSHDSNISVLGGPGGIQVIAGVPVKFVLDTNGNLVTGCFLHTNDQLTPEGSYYLVKAFDNSGIEVWSYPQQFYILPYEPTINIGSLIPETP